MMADNTERIVLDVSYQPQIRSPRDTRSFMLDVIVALMPAAAAAVWQFGAHMFVLLIASVASAVFFEWAYRKLMKKDCRIRDLSACVTGLILGLSMPPSAPWWIPIIGTFFAIVVVKQLYGGIGKNFLNPALAGRAFLLASYALILGTFSAPRTLLNADLGVDAVSMATPLTYLYSGTALPDYYTVKSLFLGAIPGSAGEVSALAILIGFGYLMARKVITWHIPVSYVGSVAVLSLIFGHSGYGNGGWMVYNVLTGSVLFSAVFMATDYATSPVTIQGQLIYGFGCGALTMLIRYFGAYPEGSTYAILIMNLCVWALDKAGHRSQFGGMKKSQIRYGNKAERYERLAQKYREKAGAEK